MKTKLLCALLACSLLALFVRATRVPAASPRKTGLDAPASPVAAAGAEALAPAGTVPRRAAAPRPAGRPAPLPVLRDDALRGALRRIARVELTDEEALEAALLPVIGNPPTLDRVLELLPAGGLSAGRPGARSLTSEEAGALRALTLAAAVFRAPPELSAAFARRGTTQDGRAFLERVLRTLPFVWPPTREALAGLLARTRGADGAPLLDLAFEPLLRELAAQHPPLADLFLDLLADALAALPPSAAGTTDLLELERATSPRLLAVSLTRLLRGPRAEHTLSWAAALHDRQGTGDELRAAITTAVAATAPVDAAARFLAERAHPYLLDEVLLLGARAGGLDALAAAYLVARVGGSEVAQRHLLVSGMQGAAPGDLLAIAAEDPSARVRGQALLTLTADGSLRATPETIAFLRAGFAAREDARHGLPASAVVYALGNLARTPPDGTAARAAHERALAFLRELVLDESLSSSLRGHAFASLAPHLTAGDRAALEARWKP